MVFVDFRVFDEHIKEHYKHLGVYLIQIKDIYERRAVYDHVKSFYPDYQELFYEAVEENIPKLLEEMRTPSLFSSKKIFFLDDASQLKKNAIPLKQLFPDSVLILGCSSKKEPLNSILLEKACSLDLSKEKPWEKEKRLSDFLATLFSKHKKRLKPTCYPVLFEKVGFDLALLEQQVLKLVCYTGDREEIVELDIEQVVIEEETQTAWKLGEEIVWKNIWQYERPQGKSQIDSSVFYPLISSLRYQLQLGLQICLLLEEGKNDLSPYFSKVFPATLKKRVQEVKIFGKSYFKQGLKELFKMELYSKSYSHSFSSYLDSFVTKLTYY